MKMHGTGNIKFRKRTQTGLLFTNLCLFSPTALPVNLHNTSKYEANSKVFKTIPMTLVVWFSAEKVAALCTY
jgi:hypothetical protein